MNWRSDLAFNRAEEQFERDRDRLYTDIPEPDDDAPYEGDPCPKCGAPVKTSSMGPGHLERWCENADCDWGDL